MQFQSTHSITECDEEDIMYQLHVKTKTKESVLTREEVPALENLLDALKVQRIDIQRNEADSEKLQKEWMNALVDFAIRFWGGHALTKKDVLTGVSAVDGYNEIMAAVVATLGYNDNDDDEVNDDPKE